MSDVNAILYLLVFLLLAQQGFYMYHMQKLVNKIMSRSYADYVANKVYPEQVKAQEKQLNGFNVQLPNTQDEEPIDFIR